MAGAMDERSTLISKCAWNTLLDGSPVLMGLLGQASWSGFPGVLCCRGY